MFGWSDQQDINTMSLVSSSKQDINPMGISFGIKSHIGKLGHGNNESQEFLRHNTGYSSCTYTFVFMSDILPTGSDEFLTWFEVTHCGTLGFFPLRKEAKSSKGYKF